MQSDPTDEILMQRYGAGDLLAFQQLYARHKHDLYRFVCWHCPRREWVDEIVQDCWAGLHTARANYVPSASFRTYLFQIARNRIIDLIRHKQASPIADTELDTHIADQASAEDSAQDDLMPERLMERKQTIAALHAAIRELPGEQKEALVLQQFNGLSLEEIASITAVPAETVKSRLRYAMRKLRLQLQPMAQQGEVA